MTPFYADDWLSIYEGDNRAVLRELPARSVHAVVTSPPYWGLRDYGIPPVEWADGWVGQLGLEPSPEQYITHLVEVMREVRRVLHPEGTLWLNLGDSFATSPAGNKTPSGLSQATPKRAGKLDQYNSRGADWRAIGLKPKDLVGVPWMAAFALRADGWWLRRDVIWSKPNPMPESVSSRPTSSHEYLFMLTPSESCYYDRIAVLEPPAPDTLKAAERAAVLDRQYQHDTDTRMGKRSPNRVWSDPDAMARLARGRNRRSVWTIATVPYPGEHFAVFPPALVEPPVMASTSEKGACPTCGAQWVRLVIPAEADADDADAGAWRPGCGCGWGGRPDDLDIIASPTVAHRDDADVAAQRQDGQRRRGLARERLPDEARRTITRYEQRAYAAQLKAMPEADRTRAMAEHDITEDAWRHYVRSDRGGRCLPTHIHEALLREQLLTPVEPPDWTGAPPPVPSVVMDPFGGSGTVGLVGQRLGRRAVLIDINAKYLRQQMARAAREFGTGGTYAAEAREPEPVPADGLWAEL